MSNINELTEHEKTLIIAKGIYDSECVLSFHNGVRILDKNPGELTSIFNPYQSEADAMKVLKHYYLCVTNLNDGKWLAAQIVDVVAVAEATNEKLEHAIADCACMVTLEKNDG